MFLKRKARVLLLDDDASMRRLVGLLLKRAGHRVSEAIKGNEAIAALEREDFDAILLDLMMPHEGGMTVLRHLRENKPQMLRRVILLTGAPDTLLSSLSDEIFAVVRKPFKPEELVSAVGELTA
jgi:CheY-like chemotaxis protein